jgi:STE24 endopeptidase
LNIYLVLIFLAYIVKEGVEYLLRYLNLQHAKKYGLTVPSEFKGNIDSVLLRKTLEYEAEKTRFSFISSIFGNIAVIIFIFGGLLNTYNSWIFSYDLSFILAGILFFMFLSYVSTVLSIPFSLYSTFKIENKYGFNTTTPRLWITDFFKSLLISTVITVVLVSIALFLIKSSADYWWVWVWGFFFVFSLFMMYISPYVLEPLFNKFTPIDDPVLEEKIGTMLQKVNVKVSRVFKMDASKRSTHTNAYFSGIGKVKRIILYDTLLEKMEHDEILSVLAHEAGHWKKKHIIKMVIGVEIISLVGIYLAFLILKTDILTDIFNIIQNTFFAKIVLLGFVASIISFPFTPLGSYISKRFEKEADRFAYELCGNTGAMESALIKLSKDNLSNLHPHPLYAAIYYSHPPIVERIKDIRALSLNKRS